MKDWTAIETDPELLKHAAMGIAAQIPGLVAAIQVLQADLDDKRLQLAAFQGRELSAAGKAEAAGEDPVLPRARRARSRKLPVSIGSTGWPDDPEERKAEMKRRMKVAEKKRGAKLRIQSKEHPGHKKWAAKIARQRRAAWDAKSPKEKRKWMDAINAGKAKSKKKGGRRAAVPPPTALALGATA